MFTAYFEVGREKGVEMDCDMKYTIKYHKIKLWIYLYLRFLIGIERKSLSWLELSWAEASPGRETTRHFELAYLAK